MKRIIPFLALLSYSAYSQAGWITLDPADFAIGTPIQTADALGVNVEDWIEKPLYSSRGPLLPGRQDLNIPVFTRDPNGLPSSFTTNKWPTPAGDIQFGLLFEFSAPVDALDILVINTLGRSNGLDCFTYTPDGTPGLCDHGDGPAPGGIPDLIPTVAHFTFPQEITKFYLGGGDQTAFMYFGTMSFHVPEPGSLALLSAGMGALFLGRRRRSLTMRN